MLTARALFGAALGATLALATVGARADTDEPEGTLHRPERQTVSANDDLLGQLSPDGQTLYFVSNRNQRSEIFAQGIADGRARRLFDEGADVTWPRISPDGSQLLYVSFAGNVLGQLCVRELRDVSDRRCLAESSAILQAEWIDRSRIVAVSRRSLHGDLRVLEVAGESKLTARTLLDRNLTGPAVSPDGKWLVYVPIERDVPSIGPAFASHSARRLEAAPLASPNVTPTPLAIDLPGLTGQPAFARDGRSITVVQFIDDTNHDGVIDANDDGVLFRVPFSTTNGAPALGPPEQLTEASINCEYPAPGPDRLVATCAKRNGLEIYALPLGGEAPADWSAPRLASEIETAANRSEQQLLGSLRLARETSTTGRRLALLMLVRLHLELDQFEAAEFYAGRIADLRDRATEGLSRVVVTLVAHRRAVNLRERGLFLGSFTEQARRRLEALHVAENASPTARALEHVVRSEIADSIGDKTAARAELEAVSLDASASGPVVEAYYERADALYRELDDRDALVVVCRRLSEIAALTSEERLRYARAAVHAMVRGLPFDAAAKRVARERATVTADAELSFALEMAEAVLDLRDAHPSPSATERLLALYARESSATRRRALVDEVVARASQVGADEVVQALAQRYIVDVRRGTTDRRPAERLYRRVMTSRALRRASERRLTEARADFDAIAEHTDSYEAIVESIDLGLEAGESMASMGARYTKPGTPRALSHFTRAYLLARSLPALEGESATRATTEALALLRASWAELAGRRIVDAVQGALLHDRYLRTGDLAFAERANISYEIALDLMGRGTKLRAMVLGQLGMLHTQVGNHRIAIGYLDDREKLQNPNATGPTELAIRLAHARALMHVARESDAATIADRAVAMVERQPALAPYRVLAIDRAAVCNLAAGRFARAVALYDLLLPQLDAATDPMAARNRFVARVARAAALVGSNQPERGLADLDVVERKLNDASFVEELTRSHVSSAHAVRMYRVIALGLRARAYRAQGRLDEEARTSSARHALQETAFLATQRAEDERSLMLTEMQLAQNGRDRGDPEATATWLTRALSRADDLRARAGGQLDNTQLDALWLSAQLTLEMKTVLVRDLAERLEGATSAIAASHDASLRSYERWFEAYLPLMRPAAHP